VREANIVGWRALSVQPWKDKTHRATVTKPKNGIPEEMLFPMNPTWASDPEKTKYLQRHPLFLYEKIVGRQPDRTINEQASKLEFFLTPLHARTLGKIDRLKVESEGIAHWAKVGIWYSAQNLGIAKYRSMIKECIDALDIEKVREAGGLEAGEPVPNYTSYSTRHDYINNCADEISGNAEMIHDSLVKCTGHAQNSTAVLGYLTANAGNQHRTREHLMGVGRETPSMGGPVAQHHQPLQQLSGNHPSAPSSDSMPTFGIPGAQHDHQQQQQQQQQAPAGDDGQGVARQGGPMNYVEPHPQPRTGPIQQPHSQSDRYESRAEQADFGTFFGNPSRP